MQALATANPFGYLLCFARCSRDVDECLDMPVSVAHLSLIPLLPERDKRRRAPRSETSTVQLIESAADRGRIRRKIPSVIPRIGLTGCASAVCPAHTRVADAAGVAGRPYDRCAG